MTTGKTSAVNQSSCSVVSNSSWPHGLQHARLPCHHQLPELIQTHVHWVGDTIQPSHCKLWLYGPVPAKWPLCFLTHRKSRKEPSQDESRSQDRSWRTAANWKQPSTALASSGRPSSQNRRGPGPPKPCLMVTSRGRGLCPWAPFYRSARCTLLCSRPQNWLWAPEQQPLPPSPG